MTTVANASTRALLDFCHRRGVDVPRMLSGADVTRDMIETVDARIGLAAMIRVWSAGRIATADELLGLHTAAVVPFGAYRTLDFLVLTSATLGDALAKLSRFYALAHGGAHLLVHRGRDEIRVLLEEADVPSEHLRSALEFSFAIIVSRLRFATRTEWSPRRVLFGVPAPAAIEDHVGVFRSRVGFAQPSHEIVLDASLASLPVAEADAGLAELLEQRAARLLRGLADETGFVEQARAAMLDRLAHRDASAAAVADALGLSVRTLQRRLRGHGTSFRQLMGDVRCDLGRELLRRDDADLDDIAAGLSFSEARAFSRAFRGWTGMSPNDYRKLT